jgi:predicted amidohydrolase YtcJ
MIRCVLTIVSAVLLSCTGAAAAPRTAATPSTAATPAAAVTPADLVLFHGKIHTEDAARSVAQALAVRGNTIVAVGTDQAIGAWVGPNTRSIDLAGRVVLPGIIDAHTHPAESSQDVGKCSLDDKPLAPPVIKTRLASCMREKPGDPAEWFEVVMVDPSGLTLTLADLDSMLLDRPLLLSGSDGHTVWVNSAALNVAHITAATPDPPGGHIEHDAAGRPTGTLRDRAAELALAAKPAASLDAEAALLGKALDSMRATGITSVQDAAVDDHLMRMYKYLYDAHRLNMRVRGSFHLKDLREPRRYSIGKAVKFRAKWAIDPDFLRADAVKIFADGVIEYPSQTAALLQPYLDAHGRPTQESRSVVFHARQSESPIVTAADAAGLTVHIHAIGDRAVRSSLGRDRGCPAAQRQHLDNRDQIAHLELIDPRIFRASRSWE